MRNLVPLLLVPLLPACLLSRGHANHPIDRTAYERLEVGTSSARDASDLLGAPVEVVQLDTGSAWRYEYSQTKRTGLLLILVGLLNDDTQSDRVWLFFDAGGTLVNAAASFEAGLAEWEMPWSGDGR